MPGNVQGLREEGCSRPGLASVQALKYLAKVLVGFSETHQEPISTFRYLMKILFPGLVSQTF